LVCLFVFVLFVVYFYVYYYFLSFSFLFSLWLLGFLCLLRLDFSRLLSVSVVLSCVFCFFWRWFLQFSGSMLQHAANIVQMASKTSIRKNEGPQQC
jgi:hypothetical protein